MKLLVIYILLYSLNSFAISPYEKSKRLYNKYGLRSSFEIAKSLIDAKLYASSIPFIKYHLLNNDIDLDKNGDVDRLIEKVIIRLGILPFEDLPTDILEKSKTTSIKLILAKRYFYEKKYDKSIHHSKRIDQRHTLFSESSLVLGNIYKEQNKYQESIKAYSSCIKWSDFHATRVKSEKIKRYYNVLKEICIINQARIEYQKQNFEIAENLYSKIPKTSYRWPYTLLEKGWASYKMNNYNRSLGVLVTYKSPLLSSYFTPEAEVLMALNYHKLCAWKEAEEVISNYQNKYKASSNSLKRFVNKMKNKKDFFYKLTFVNPKTLDRVNPYIRNLVAQIKKKVKYNLNLQTFNRLLGERNRLKKVSENKLKEIIIASINHEIENVKSEINTFVKVQMYNFINDIYKYSYEMFNIQLDLISKKRTIIYHKTLGRDTLSKREDVSPEDISLKKYQEFWKFTGEFWADELGDYSFGMKSRCK